MVVWRQNSPQLREILARSGWRERWEHSAAPRGWQWKDSSSCRCGIMECCGLEGTQRSASSKAPAWGRDAARSPRLLRAASHTALNAAREGAAPPRNSLGQEGPLEVSCSSHCWVLWTGARWTPCGCWMDAVAGSAGCWRVSEAAGGCWRLLEGARGCRGVLAGC